MAFNVIGDPIKKSLQHISDEYLNEQSNKPDYISPMDDLAFDMYQVICGKICALED